MVPQPLDLLAETASPNAFSLPDFSFYPVFSTKTGNIRGDKFANDCLHRHYRKFAIFIPTSLAHEAMHMPQFTQDLIPSLLAAIREGRDRWPRPEHSQMWVSIWPGAEYDGGDSAS